MSYTNYYQRMRVKSVQIFDKMFFEKENHQKCHKQIWKKMGRFIFGISYDTYLHYLKIDVSDIPDIPSEAVDKMDAFVEELKSREKNLLKPVKAKKQLEEGLPDPEKTKKPSSGK